MHTVLPVTKILLFYAPVNFFPRVWKAGLPQGILTILKNWCLIPYPCDIIMCQKSPGRASKLDIISWRFSH